MWEHLRPHRDGQFTSCDGDAASESSRCESRRFFRGFGSGMPSRRRRSSSSRPRATIASTGSPFKRRTPAREMRFAWKSIVQALNERGVPART